MSTSSTLVATSLKGKVYVIDLSKSITRCHDFPLISHSQMDYKFYLFNFQQSGLVCIGQKLSEFYFKDPRSWECDWDCPSPKIKLTYFSIADLQIRKAKIWEKTVHNTRNMSIKKTDEHSGLAMVLTYQSGPVTIMAHHLTIKTIYFYHEHISKFTDYVLDVNFNFIKIKYVRRLGDGQLRLFF